MLRFLCAKNQQLNNRIQLLIIFLKNQIEKHIRIGVIRKKDTLFFVWVTFINIGKDITHLCIDILIRISIDIEMQFIWNPMFFAGILKGTNTIVSGNFLWNISINVNQNIAFITNQKRGCL